MRCQAKTAKGSRCTRQGWRDTPICTLHIPLLYREFMRACGFTKRREFHWLDNEDECEAEDC